MNFEKMKQLIENEENLVIRDAYIESFEAMTGWTYEMLYMTDEERRANVEMYHLQQDEYETVEFVETFTSLQ